MAFACELAVLVQGRFYWLLGAVQWGEGYIVPLAPLSYALRYLREL